MAIWLTVVGATIACWLIVIEHYFIERERRASMTEVENRSEDDRRAW